MNTVEIADAVGELAAAPFDPAEFPYQFLQSFGVKETTLKMLRAGNANQSDVPGAILQRNNIHLMVCERGQATASIDAMKRSPRTTKAKAKFVLATDGEVLEAEDLASGETLACAYPDFANHFGFFLPLAGFSTVKEIRDNPIDIQATGRLNKLYVELLKENPTWDTDERRHDMNVFLARLIFCFFAEDTGIFFGQSEFTRTVETMSDSMSSNTHEVIGKLFAWMDTPPDQRAGAGLPNWINKFPYVNGGLFAGSKEVPRFSRIARSLFLHAGRLEWTKINPDIFGSMIQAVAETDERANLGMHYTSVPNILKVLNPLFLDSLREQLEAGRDNPRKLLNLRKRLSNIRVFDPACGSGNFLVIAYREMREIEAEIIRLRGDTDKKSWIKLTNFYGIEIKGFSAEIARLALLIAEFQLDARLIGQQEAILDVLPLKKSGQIICGNALRLDWLVACPVTPIHSADPRGVLDADPSQGEGETEKAKVETYICGNPPYRGATWQTDDQKGDLKFIFDGRVKNWKSLDYVSGWFMKAADYGLFTYSRAAFVSTNSICQGHQVSVLWPHIFLTGSEIFFAHTSFKWANLASHNAGVTVAIVGIGAPPFEGRYIFDESPNNPSSATVRNVSNINAYLVSGPNVIIDKLTFPADDRSPLTWGNKPADGGHLLMNFDQKEALTKASPEAAKFIRPFPGASEFIQGNSRFCLWIADQEVAEARQHNEIAERLGRVADMRSRSPKRPTAEASNVPHRFVEVRQTGNERDIIVVPGISSENRHYLPCGMVPSGTILSNKCYAFFEAPLWNLSLVASRIHWVWIGTVCIRMRTDFSYSNTLGWNTFPVPSLTEKNKADLTRCAEDILLARERYFPATIADMYDPERMDEEFPLLREAHERNDETLERIYIGRRFRNDTERLEKLFEMYTKMTADEAAQPKAKRRKGEA
jgi:hypothetical protein